MVRLDIAEFMVLCFSWNSCMWMLGAW